MATARARHILVETEQQCIELKDTIEKGGDFAEMAMKYSQCPSGQNGGDLGEFGQGQMVPEFDKVVFNDEVGKGSRTSPDPIWIPPVGNYQPHRLERV